MDELEQLGAEISECRKCALCETRHNPVYGEGNRTPKAEEIIDPDAHITQVRGKWIEWQNRWVMPGRI
jgi:Uracil-DNA glycosylase